MRLSEPVARRGTQQNRGGPSTTTSIKNVQSQRNTKPVTHTRNYHLNNLYNSSSSSDAYLKSSDSPQLLLLEFTRSNMKAYVIQGLYYFLRHKILWKTTLWPIFWSLIFVISALCILLPLAFIPQAIFLSTIMTPFLGIPLALIMALLELLVVVMIFSAVVLLPITDKLFDEVLILRGHAELVESDQGGGCCGCCSVVSVMHLVVSIITLPLNLIPFAGTVLWLFVNGRLYTWDAHSHYHKELKGRSFFAQRKFVRRHWWGYHLFGMQAMSLELIPMANVLFLFTNTVGAALWAADMEDTLLEHSEDCVSASAADADVTGNSATDNKNSLSFPTEETTLPVSSGKDEYGA